MADATGSIDAMWFRAPYLKTKLTNGSDHLLYGRVHQWRAGERLLVSPKFMNGPQIMPVYSEIGGLTSEKIRRLIGDLLPICSTITDHIGEPIRSQLNVDELGKSLKQIHAPNSLTEINRAKDRFGFEELIMTAVPSLLAKQAREKEKALPLQPHKEAIDAWIQTLPFELTASQKESIDVISADLTLDRPMNRLLQGDVGSGKTVVALAAALETYLSGRQVVWLAPTELLAEQHYHTMRRLLCHPERSEGFSSGAVSGQILRSAQNDNINVALWTRSQKLLNDEVALPAKLKSADIIIGTHAVLQNDITFDNLGLLIIDEQHRFGVKQRALLRKLSGNPVHLLSMTATPIPRTMALTVYGDLDVSTLKDKPLGRKHITTRVVEELNRVKAYEFIDKHIAAGRQIYVVCPMIEPSQDAEATVFVSLFQPVEERKAVKTQYEEMQKLFPNRSIGLLHGKMKADEKAEAMEDFRTGKIDILVSTKDRHSELSLLLQSLRTQTFQKWNLFILDNASGTPITNAYFINYLINRLKLEGHFVQILRNNVDFGICYARNLLNDEQEKYKFGEYSMRLDDDVIPEPDYIEKLFQVIDEGYDIASGLVPPFSFPNIKREIKFLKGELNKVRIDMNGEINEFGDDCGYCYIEKEIIPAGHFRSCALYKSEINAKIRYPDNLSKYGFREESFFSLKCRMQGYKIGVHTGAICYHLQTPSGGGRSILTSEIIQQDDVTFRKWIKKKYLAGELK